MPGCKVRRPVKTVAIGLKESTAQVDKDTTLRHTYLLPTHIHAYMEKYRVIIYNVTNIWKGNFRGGFFLVGIFLGEIPGRNFPGRANFPDPAYYNTRVDCLSLKQSSYMQLYPS